MIKSIGKTLNTILKATILILATVIIGIFLVRGAFGLEKEERDGGGNAGEGGGNVGGCDAYNKSYGGCYNGNDPKPFWIYIDITPEMGGDNVPFSSLHSWRYDKQKYRGGPAYFSNLRTAVRNSAIKDCYKYGKGAYVLVRKLYYGSGNSREPYGLMAGVTLKEAFSSHEDTDDSWKVGRPASWKEAEEKFAEGAHWDDDGDDTTINHIKWDNESQLTWFCADYNPETKSTTSTTSTDTIRRLNCKGDHAVDKANTVTRIAVQNMSLDGNYNPTDHNGEPVLWRAKGSRSGIRSDSLFSDGDDTDIYTLAKPGDSIRFYHGVCMAVRYGQRTTHYRGERTTFENHNQEYNVLGNNWMTIEAIPSVYAFEDKGTWNNFKSQVRNVTAHENLFTYHGQSGMRVNDVRDAIDIINPSPDRNDYTCNEIEWYASRDRFITGGYHIPGFRAYARACTSASKTHIPNTVGNTIIQQHAFNPLRMWERYSTSYTGTCGCGNSNHDAHITGGSYDQDYNRAHSGTSEHAWLDEYACEGDGECCPGNNRDEYGVCKVAEESNYKFTDKSYNRYYMVVDEWHGERREKRATVYVPYNFNTTVSSSIDSNDVVFQGASVTANYSWAITPRKNDKTAPDWSGYATYTPDEGEDNETHVVLLEWIYYPGEQKIEGSEFSDKKPSLYYSAGVVPGTYNEYRDYVGDQNPTGDYNGAYHGESHTRTIPDNGEYVGYKYCTAIAIYPADSHNGTDNSLNIQKRKGENGAMDAGERWNISGASCRAIAKKPNFQVWNGSVYTEGTINTSISRKWTDVSTVRLWSDYNPSSTDIFGSWADYAIIAGKNNKTMASGAMLGYNNSPADNGYYELNGKGGKPAGTTARDLAPETIANDNTPTGKSNINASASYHQNLARLDSRYRDKAATLIKEVDGSVVGSKKIYAAKTGTQAASVSGDVKISDLWLDSSVDASNLTNDGNGLVKQKLTDTNNSKKDNTLIIVSSGTLVIDRNICYGSCNGDATMLKTYNSVATNKAASLPQILIFAKNIEIYEGVTRVDAWLIAEGDENGSGGTLNTCYKHKIGYDDGAITGLIARDANTMPRYTLGNCGLTLVINGPVFANHIDLLRTAGAFHGSAPSGGVGSDPRNRSVGATGSDDDRNKGSVAPAEIFNLRADVYIWAYNQAQRYSEAVVTYTRELAPRY